MRINASGKGWWAGGLVLAGLAVLFLPGLVEHVRLSADRLVFNDDVRQHVFAFYPYYQPGLLDGDYLARYILALSPPGHSLVYILAARLWDPAWVSKVLPYLQYAGVLVLLGACARRLGGWPAVFATLALALSSHVLLDYMTGGVARSWAYPLMAGAAAALVWGRVYPLAVITVLGAALYPPAAAVCGIGLALWLLLWPAADRGAASDWSWPKRWGLVAVTALVCAALVLPMAMGLRQYGRRLGPADVAAYPELGPGGRYGPDDRSPYPYVWIATADAFGRSLLAGQDAWWPSLRRALQKGSRPGRPAVALVIAVGVVGVACLAGLGLAFRERPELRRLLALLAASLVGYGLAKLLAPYLFLPHRYLVYSIPILTFLAFPVAISALVRGRPRATRPGLAPAVVIAATLVVLLTLGGQGGGRTGLSSHSKKLGPGFYRRLAALPVGAKIAGWPNGVVDDLPYLCRRPALVTFECHQAFHQGFADEMRRRMRALMAAYFATSPQPLRELRRRFGVGYLVVDLRHLGPKPPRYFAPFDQWTSAAHRAMRSRGSEVLRQLDRAAVFRQGDLVVLDLSKIAG